MRLVRLIYASKFTEGTDTSELAKIHATAKQKNDDHNITGMLAFGNDYFLQCLEGGRQSVNQLYTLISHDKRHNDILLLEYAEIAERDFDQWSMKLVLLTQENLTFLRKFSATPEFDPYQLSSKSAYHLMLSLR